MAPPPDFTDFNHLLHDETAILNCNDMPPSAAPTSPNIRFQLPYALPSEPQMGMSSIHYVYGAPQTTQGPYFALENALNSFSTALPQTVTTYHDDSVWARLWNGISRTDLSEFGLMQPSPMFPVIPQPLSTLPVLPILAPRWIEVPQRPYDHGRRQWNFKRLEPVLFGVNGLPGINMGDALRKQFTGLDGRDDPVLQDTTGVISCRLMFPGYLSNAYQISTLSWAKDRVPITRSKLAYEVAKKLDLYLRSMTGYPMGPSADQQWKIGEGLVRLESLYLVRLVSVSKGSFQPEIWVMDTSM